MSLRAPQTELEKLYAHAIEGYPHEVVGIIAGERSTGTVQRVQPLINERSDSAHNRYRVSGLVLMRAEQALESEGFEILGYYHSHPDHPTQYSETDREHALPNMSYVIVSVCDGAIADIASWRLKDDRTAMDPESIQSV